MADVKQVHFVAKRIECVNRIELGACANFCDNAPMVNWFRNWVRLLIHIYAFPNAPTKVMIIKPYEHVILFLNDLVNK